jgi:hypothetical protein
MLINKLKTKGIFLLRLLFIISFIFSSCTTKKNDEKQKDDNPAEMKLPSNSTLDELGASIIFLLKENDFEKYTEFLPYEVDVEKIAIKYGGPKDMKAQLILRMNENVRNIRINSKCGFDEVFNQGLKKNIDWQYVKFEFVEYVLTHKNNLQSAAVNVIFSFKNIQYCIIVKECVDTERGWLIFNKVEWQSS